MRKLNETAQMHANGGDGMNWKAFAKAYVEAFKTVVQTVVQHYTK